MMLRSDRIREEVRSAYMKPSRIESALLHLLLDDRCSLEDGSRRLLRCDEDAQRCASGQKNYEHPYNQHRRGLKSNGVGKELVGSRGHKRAGDEQKEDAH